MKLSRNALKDAKAKARQFKREKILSEEENKVKEDVESPQIDIDLNNDVVKSMLKKGFKPEDITPAMITHHQNKKKKVSKKQIKRSADLSSMPQPKVSWNVEKGDLVSFSFGSEEKFGIVLEIQQESENMRNHQSLVISSMGRNWHSTKTIKKIN